jgi:hypothetical protein
MAASATFALNAGLCVRRARLAIVAPDLRHSRRLQAETPLIDLSEFGQPPLASAKVGLRALARRWLALDQEIKDHDAHIEQFTLHCAPKLVEAHGIKANTAADMLLPSGRLCPALCSRRD